MYVGIFIATLIVIVVLLPSVEASQGDGVQELRKTKVATVDAIEILPVAAAQPPKGLSSFLSAIVAAQTMELKTEIATLKAHVKKQDAALARARGGPARSAVGRGSVGLGPLGGLE